MNNWGVKTRTDPTPLTNPLHIKSVSLLFICNKFNKLYKFGITICFSNVESNQSEIGLPIIEIAIK